jgi:hypothetical protein
MNRRGFLIAGPVVGLSSSLSWALGTETPQSAVGAEMVRIRPSAVGADTPRSPITNLWGTASTVKHDLEEICVFRGRPGGAYNHHHQILFDRGRLYASWDNGIVNEDNPGQHMLFSVSDDDGKTWSAAAQITPPPIEETSTYTAEGIRAYQGKLMAYYGHFGYTDLSLYRSGAPNKAFDYFNGHCLNDYRGSPDAWVHRETFTAVRVSEDAGRTWGSPIRIIEKFVPNLRPFPIRGGRLIVPGNITYPYTDDPAGIQGWKSTGMPRQPVWTVDDPEGFHKVAFFRHDPFNYAEASFFQTDDGVIHMMQRIDAIPPNGREGLLGVTESVDNGETWSEPMLTSYTDCACRFQFGRLPDGRFFGLSCPDPTSDRTPLVLATSRDGIIFGQHNVLGSITGTKPRIPGGAKSGVYGYPSCDIADGKMYIIFSRNKEDIYFSKLNLSAIA